MAITRALEFDQTPNKLLFEIGEQARQQALLKQKLERENNDKRLQVLGEINPASLYPKFEKEVVDAGINGLLNNVSNFLKENPNASDVDLRMQINNGLGGMAQWSAKKKVVEENIDKTIQNMDRDAPFDKGRLRALAIDRALYKTDQFGRKVLKPAEEIDIESDIVGSIANNEPDKVIDAFKGQDMATKLINDASLFTQNVENTIETPDGRKTVVTGQKSSVPFYLEPDNGNLRVKQQKDGYIDEDVYQRFYQNPAMRVWIDANAKTIMDKGRVPESPEAAEWFRRSFLTNWLDQNKKGVIDKVDKELYARPSAGVTVNLGGPLGGGKGYEDAYQTLAERVDSGKLNKLPANIAEVVVKIANEQGKLGMLRGGNVKYTIKNLDIKRDSDGSIRIYDKLTGDKESIYIDPKDFNISYNNLFGTKAQSAATNTPEEVYLGIGKDGKPMYGPKK